MSQTLTCEHDGHTWTRPVTRGQRPHFCPVHRPVKVEPQPQPKAAAEHGSKVSEAALELLTGGAITDPEFERKLTYVVEQLDDPCVVGRRDPNDIKLLVQTQKELANEGQRRFK